VAISAIYLIDLFMSFSLHVCCHPYKPDDHLLNLTFAILPAALP
jgi:hypothetical protein